MKYSARNLLLGYRTALQASHKLQVDRVSLYLVVMKLLFRDARRVTHFEIPAAVSIGIAALTAQVGAFSAILYVFSHIEESQPQSLPAAIMGVNINGATFISFALLIGSLTVAATFFQYASERKVSKAVKKFEAHAYRSLLTISTYLPLPGAATANEFIGVRMIGQTLSSVPRICSMSLRRFVAGVVPLVQTVVALGTLLILDVMTTTVVVAVLLLAGFSIYSINLAAVRLGWKVESTVTELNADRKSVMRQLSFSSKGDIRQVVADHTAGPVYIAAIDAFFDRLLIIDKSTFATGVIGAVLLAMVVGVNGWQVMFGDGSMAALLAYLLALRYFSSGVQSVVSTVTGINQLFPRVLRYWRLVSLMDAKRICPIPEGEPLFIVVEDLETSAGRTIPFSVGSYFHIVGEKDLTKEMLVPFMDRIKWSGDAPPLGFVDYQFSPLTDTDEVIPNSQLTSAGVTDQDPVDLIWPVDYSPRLIVRNQIATDAAVNKVPENSTVVEYCRLADFRDELAAGGELVIVLLSEKRVACCSYAWLDKNRADLMMRIRTLSKQAASGGTDGDGEFA
jgi:hypothetical protein